MYHRSASQLQLQVATGPESICPFFLEKPRGELLQPAGMPNSQPEAWLRASDTADYVTALRLADASARAASDSYSDSESAAAARRPTPVADVRVPVGTLAVCVLPVTVTVGLCQRQSRGP